jgi:hypothetical protein
MLRPLHLRDLSVDAALHPRGQPHISAASGLVRAGERLYVVADDEHHLGVMECGGTAPLELHRMLHGDLPLGRAERKRRKADFEALALLPPAQGWPHGAVLALGSGSTPARERGIVLLLRADGSLQGQPRTIDLAPLYLPLRARFADLNIEGGFAAGEGFHLLQRANQGSPSNGSLTYPLHAFIAWLANPHAPLPEPHCNAFDLGGAGKVSYGFTDGTAGPAGGWIFSAVAEDTQDSYADGRCTGSAIGWVSAAGRLEGLLPIADAPKVEGIALAAPDRLLLVTDADDPDRPSQLSELRWPPEGA